LNEVWCGGCLHRWLFTAVHAVRCIIQHGREEDNNELSHGALSGETLWAQAV
jgi:hypothetical protein